MLTNNNHLVLAFILIASIIALGASSSNGPETYQIGERVTFVDGDTTITVEPATMKLYN
jgi:hypothetical protein